MYSQSCYSSHPKADLASCAAGRRVGDRKLPFSQRRAGPARAADAGHRDRAPRAGWLTRLFSAGLSLCYLASRALLVHGLYSQPAGQHAACEAFKPAGSSHARPLVHVQADSINERAMTEAIAAAVEVDIPQNLIVDNARRRFEQQLSNLAEKVRLCRQLCVSVRVLAACLTGSARHCLAQQPSVQVCERLLSERQASCTCCCGIAVTQQRAAGATRADEADRDRAGLCSLREAKVRASHCKIAPACTAHCLRCFTCYHAH